MLTTEELQIYSKKKSKVSEMRDDDPIHKPPTKLTDPEEEGFQLMKVDNNKKRDSEN